MFFIFIKAPEEQKTRVFLPLLALSSGVYDSFVLSFIPHPTTNFHAVAPRLAKTTGLHHKCAKKKQCWAPVPGFSTGFYLNSAKIFIFK